MLDYGNFLGIAILNWFELVGVFYSPHEVLSSCMYRVYSPFLQGIYTYIHVTVHIYTENDEIMLNQ